MVERGLPQVWARLGYRARSRWPSLDKPLTEVTMTRRPAAPRRALAYPWEGDDALPASGLLVSWWLGAGGALTAVVDLARRGPLAAVREHAGRVAGPAALAGAGMWAGAGHHERLAAVARLARARSGDVRDGAVLAGGAAGGVPGAAVLRFDGGAALPAAYLMPRLLDPRLLALWRFPRGLADHHRPRLPNDEERAS